MFSENVGSGMAFLRKLRMDFISAALSGIHVYSTPLLQGFDDVCGNEEAWLGAGTVSRVFLSSVVSIATAGGVVSLLSEAVSVTTPDVGVSDDTTDVELASCVADKVPADEVASGPAVAAVLLLELAVELSAGNTVVGSTKGTSARHWETSSSSLSSILFQPPRLWKADISRLVMRSMTLTALVTSWRGVGER